MQAGQDVWNTIEVDTCGGTSSGIYPSTSAKIDLPTSKMYEESVGKPEKIETNEKMMGEDKFFTGKMYGESVENAEKFEAIEEMMEEEKFVVDKMYGDYVGTPKKAEVIEEMMKNESYSDIEEKYELNPMDESAREEDVRSNASSECSWVVETVKPQQWEPSVFQGIDFVEFPYVFDQIIKLGKHSNIGCGVEHFKIVGCQQMGLEKVYNIRCEMCNHTERIPCLQKHDDTMDINRSAVATTMVTGGGYSRLEELMSGMNMSCMSKKTYEKCQDEIIDAFQLAAQREMEDAGKQERELAIARGDVYPGCNIPWIAVVADGSWMKRSYRGGDYNSLSGVGAIVGYRTKKVLYIGVKNKFCFICQSAANKGEQAREHRCFKNWDRNQSSTGIESAAIVEGFNRSMEMHNLIYATLVADSDSSVYKRILDNDPYGEYKVQVQKIECTNHLLRNFGRRINDIVTKGQHKELREIVKQNALRLRTGVKKAAEYRFTQKVNLADQIKNLKIDLKNVPSHVFGEHKECQKLAYFCKEYSNPNRTNYVPQMKEAGIYQGIEDAIHPLLAKTESLLYALNNNAVESFNSIIAKFIGGKRINFGRKGSYQGRVSAAVVQFNTKETLSRLSVAMNKSPTKLVKQMEERRKHILRMAKKYKQEAKISALRYEKQTCDHDYGPAADQPDLEETGRSSDNE